MQSLSTSTLAELSAAVARREVSPVEIVRACLDRVARLDGRLHSFLDVHADEAMADARQAERELSSGPGRGPMHGLPDGLKDLIDVAGKATTVNSAARRGKIAEMDAAVTRRLRDAGAIIIGKQALGEFMLGGTQFDLPWPPPRNPWNLEKDPSNSSSGSAVAVAAGLCPAAIGSDTGGSIRGPAAWCGIAGLKPTYGLVARTGSVDYAPSLDHLGPMAWTVEDCAILLDAIAANGAGRYAEALGEPVAGMRVGALRCYYEADPQVDEAVLEAMETTFEALRALDVEIVDVALTPAAVFNRAASTISMAEGFREHGDEFDRHEGAIGAVAMRRMRACRDVGPEEYGRALEEKIRLTREVDAVLENVDLILLPTARRPAQELGYDALRGDAFLNRPFSLTGHPALALCNGFTDDGLPLSLQIVGRHNDDATVLRLGHAVERALGLRARRPAIALQ